MIDPSAVEGKAALFVDFEDRPILFDTLILCRFYKDLYSWKHVCALVQTVTGEASDKASLRAISARIANTLRRFNMQEGLKETEDRLPKRLHRETLKSGHALEEAELKKMVADYYRLRGWDECGRPPL